MRKPQDIMEDLGVRFAWVNQASWVADETAEQCGKFPSLTDPDSEVYTVAELIQRHERGLLTNLNIGKSYAYPEFARLDDRDLEKDLGLEPTDASHLADQLDNQLKPMRKAQAEAKTKKDEEDRKAAEDAVFNARLAAEGWVKPEKGG